MLCISLWQALRFLCGSKWRRWWVVIVLVIVMVVEVLVPVNGTVPVVVAVDTVEVVVMV